MPPSSLLDSRLRFLTGSLLSLAVGLVAATSFAGDAGARVWTAPPKASAAAAPSAGARPLPPGHPNVDAEEPEDAPQEDLPPGHPPTGAGASAGTNPHAGSGGSSGSSTDRLPEDTSDIDPALPPGLISVQVLDANDQPMPRADVTLGILQQSVAKGESRRRTTQKADDSGVVHFDGLEFGGQVAYRVTVPWIGNSTGEPATYAAMPFQLDLKHGQRVRIHVYPVSNNLVDTMVAMQGIVYMELKDDAVQFDEIYQVYNLGAVTWVPSDVVIPLPAGYKAFSAQREMSDTGFDDVPSRGAKLRGTFAPGQHEIHFRYQMTYDGDESFSVSLNLPPQVARMRVIAEASKGMTLKVKDYPSSVSDRTQRGQRVLVTERQLRKGERPFSSVQIGLDNIPTEGSAKWVAVAIAAATIAMGLYVATSQSKTRDPRGKDKGQDDDAERAQTRLVAEIAALDRAHDAGELGPKSYVRIREALIDALARIMAQSA